MKHLILILIGLIFVGNALADAEIAAGDKLFGVLDQSLQSKKIKRPSNPTARQKYVNIFVTSSLIMRPSGIEVSKSSWIASKSTSISIIWLGWV